jgi:hypothetical protein
VLAVVAALALASLTVGSGTAVVGLAGGLALAAATRLFHAGGSRRRAVLGGAVGVVGLAVAALAVGLAATVAGGRLAPILAGPAVVWVGLAAGLAGTDAVGGGGVRAAGARLAPAVGAVWLAVLVLGPVTNGLATLSAAVEFSMAIVYAGGVAALVVWPLLLVAAGGLLRKALVDLPVVDLVPPGRPDERATLSALRDTGVRVAGTAAVGGLAVVMVGPFLVIPLYRTPAGLVEALGWPLGPVVGWLLLAPVVRTVLLAVALVATAALVGDHLARRKGDRTAGHRLAPSAGAVPIVVVVAALAAATGVVDRLLDVEAIGEFVAGTPLPGAEAPAALALSGIAIAAFAGLLVPGATVLVVGTTVPSRVAGPALAAVGTFGLAVLSATGGNTIAAAVGAAFALAVWDAGEHGVTLRSEVGRGPSRRAGLVHLGGSLAVGAGALAGVLALDRVVGAVAPREALPAFALALVLALAAGTVVVFVLDG